MSKTPDMTGWYVSVDPPPHASSFAATCTDDALNKRRYVSPANDAHTEIVYVQPAVSETMQRVYKLCALFVATLKAYAGHVNGGAAEGDRDRDTDEVGVNERERDGVGDGVFDTLLVTERVGVFDCEGAVDAYTAQSVVDVVMRSVPEQAAPP